jgi:hypothetical protein
MREGPTTLEGTASAQPRVPANTLPKPVIVTRQEAIMPRVLPIAALIVLAFAGAAAREFRQAGAPAMVPMTAYDDFTKLSDEDRRARFASISAENKAMIMRTHVELWLRHNRERLTASEIAVFQEMIGYITPDIYRTQSNGLVDKREDGLRATMRCRVSPDDVREATNVIRTERPSASRQPTWSYLQQGRCWIDWFLEGLGDYIPSPSG